jgi:hypothetical protein
MPLSVKYLTHTNKEKPNMGFFVLSYIFIIKQNDGGIIY